MESHFKKRKMKTTRLDEYKYQTWLGNTRLRNMLKTVT